MSYITGVGLTSFGRHDGSSSLDLMSQAASQPAPAAAPAQTAASAPPPPPPPPANVSTDKLVGQDVGAGEYACLPGDNSPAGTISSDGLKKVMTPTPFGLPICRWVK